MAKFFTAEGLVIITSKDEVSAFQWRKYIEKNWDDLKQKNAVREHSYMTSDIWVGR